ncbi:MAG: TolC family protein [Pirellulales bacterium]|nr:TolC family protein [Pirellulales bacterium]
MQPGTSRAEPWSLFAEPPVESDPGTFVGEIPGVLSTTYRQAEVPPAGSGVVVTAAAQLPLPAEEMPVPPGQPPPIARPFGDFPADNIDNRNQPLTLSEVLESVLRHYPLLLAVEQERGVASGGLTSAMGAFDTQLTGMGTSLAPSTYENYVSDFGVEQLLSQQGISLFGGYRTGFGEFPTYKLHNKTAVGGEFRGGLSIPLARDRDIDRARAGKAQAQLDVAIAEPAIARSRLDYMREAARAYWAWAGSGEQRTATQSLVQLATDRDQFLAARVDRGATANIERVDNQRNIALREGMAVKADRLVQQAAIDLSLYYRDEAGRPLLVGKQRLRRLPEPIPPTPTLYHESLSRALAQRPEFRKLSLQRQKLLVERKLAANETLPGLDAQIAANQDLGYGKSPLSGPEGLNRQVLSAALVFQLPAQRRGARGRLQALDAKISQLNEQLRYMEDNVQAQVQNAYSKLERAYTFHEKTLEMVTLADTVARAEREQFRLGRSDILRIALREQAKFDADLYEIVARQQFWTAESDLRASDTSLGPGATGEVDTAEEIPLPTGAWTDTPAIPTATAPPTTQPRILR